jgi:thymidine kinase
LDFIFVVYNTIIMFFVPPYDQELPERVSRGWVEAICGPMFSGKTEELIRRLNRAIIAGQKVEIFKPATDKRYDFENVVSHNKNSIRSTAVDFAGDILLFAGNSAVIGIDEVQFFDDQIIEVVDKLANLGKRVIITGLDTDYTGKPFGPMPHLLALAEYVSKLHAICVKCGALASYSYRLTGHLNQIVVGEKDIYEPRCRQCFNLGKNAKKLI